MADSLCQINCDFWHWIAIFIEGIRLLCQISCASTDIDRSQILLDTWQLLLPNFLGENGQTYNAHIVQHLPAQVRQFGSLWSISEFPFEAFNGLYTRMIKSGKGIIQQLTRRVILSKVAYSWIQEHKGTDSSISGLLKKLFPKSMISYDTEKSVELLDNCSSIAADVQSVLKGHFGLEKSLSYALRASFNGYLFHSSLYYKKIRSQNASNLVILKDTETQSVIFGEIVVFVKCMLEIFVVYEKFETRGTIVDYVPPPSDRNLRNLYDQSLYGRFFLVCTAPMNCFCVILKILFVNLF